MTTPRSIRRLALQALFQLDARDGDADAVRASILRSVGERAPRLSDADTRRALDLAQAAYADRARADAAVTALAPDWPVARQPAVDRALLRLAHYEMTSGVTPPKAAVNEAVELAKEFSTERSPAFINGVLDKVLHTVLRDDQPVPPAPGSTADPGSGLTAVAPSASEATDPATDSSIPA